MPHWDIAESMSSLQVPFPAAFPYFFALARKKQDTSNCWAPYQALHENQDWFLRRRSCRQGFPAPHFGQSYNEWFFGFPPDYVYGQAIGYPGIPKKGETRQYLELQELVVWRVILAHCHLLSSFPTSNTFKQPWHQAATPCQICQIAFTTLSTLQISVSSRFRTHHFPHAYPTPIKHALMKILIEPSI